MGCGGDDNGGGIKNPPDTPDTVASAEEAEQYFYDVWGTLTDDQKEMFLNYINGRLPDDITPIEKLDDLPDEYWEGVKDNWDDIKEPLQDFVDEVKEQNDTTPSERWSGWADDDTQATIQYSVDSDGVCTIIIGGTAETDMGNIWKANSSYAYTGKAGASYTYVFEAWTLTGERTIRVQYFGGGIGDIAGPPYLSQNIDITATRKEYIIVGEDLFKGGVIPMEFQCANQLGTFYIKIVSISESNAQVYWRDGKEYTGNGTVRIIHWPDEHNAQPETVTVGTVANGKLTLNLLSSVPDQYLSKGSDWPSGITVTPSDVLLYMGSLRFFEGDTEQGGGDNISFQVSSENDYHGVVYMYSSKAAKISGSYSYGEGDSYTTQTMNIDAKAGWNKVYAYQSGTDMTITTDMSGVPSGLKWTIIRDSPSGGGQ
jgi:hypothetical protein